MRYAVRRRPSRAVELFDGLRRHSPTRSSESGSLDSQARRIRAPTPPIGIVPTHIDGRVNGRTSDSGASQGGAAAKSYSPRMRTGVPSFSTRVPPASTVHVSAHSNSQCASVAEQAHAAVAGGLSGQVLLVKGKADTVLEIERPGHQPVRINRADMRLLPPIQVEQPDRRRVCSPTAADRPPADQFAVLVRPEDLCRLVDDYHASMPCAGRIASRHRAVRQLVVEPDVRDDEQRAGDRDDRGRRD